MNFLASIDVLDGQVVRLRQRDFFRPKQYASQPEQVAALLRDSGITEVLLTDLNSLRCSVPAGMHWIKRFKQYGMKVIYRGGITHCNAAEVALELGASKVVVEFPDRDKAPEEFLKDWNPDRFILAADAWGGILSNRNEEMVSAIQKMLPFGIEEVLVQDIQRQGMLLGPDVALFGRLVQQLGSSVKLLGTGGVRDEADANKLISLGVDRVAIGKALLEGSFPLSALRAAPVAAAEFPGQRVAVGA